MAGQIRLACIDCDREDFDGIDEIPENWSYVDAVDAGECEWWTHLGWCPDCIIEHERRRQEIERFIDTEAESR